MKIIKYKKIFISISVFLVLASLASIAYFGFKPGIDFKGGTAIEISWKESIRPEPALVSSIFNGIEGAPEILIQPLGDSSYVLKMREVTPAEREAITSIISNQYPGMTVSGYTTIGPSVGKELLRKSIISIILVSLGIVLFIAYSFRRVSYPVKSWKYGVTAIGTLLHDVLIPTGIFVALSSFYGIEVDTLFVVSLLTILGLSVSDTIVVFDRIRENLTNGKSGISFADTVNKSINEVYARSLMTSVTVMLVLISLSIWGPDSTRILSIMLTAGMFFGTYSSIFLASPILVMWQEYSDKKNAKKA
jgi:preprotein translocase subunit SecF